MSIFGGKCHRVKRLISAGIDDPLSNADEAKVLAHVAFCQDCREEMAFYNRLRKNLADLEMKQPPRYLWERISLQLDEHPWGSNAEGETNYAQKLVPGWSALRGTNLSSIIVCCILIAFLCLFPGMEAIQTDSDVPESAQAGELDPNLEYLSLYMIANHDIFPDQVREYYLTQLESLEGKIKMIKAALDRFPGNRRIRAQLAMVYRHKLALYQHIGVVDVETIDTVPRNFSAKRGDFYD